MDAIPPAAAAESSCRALRKMPRPRPVRLTAAGRSYGVAITLIVVVFEVALVSQLYRELHHEGSTGVFTAREWIACVGVLLFLIVLASLPCTLARHRSLLANGDIALGKVVKQWRMKGNFYIRYTCEAGGATFERRAIDATHMLVEESAVPIFYDPKKPSRQVAECAAYYNVAMLARH